MLMLRGLSPDIVRPRLGDRTGARSLDSFAGRCTADAEGRDAVGFLKTIP